MTTVADLSPEERADLFAQVGEVMNSPGFNYQGHIDGNTVNGVFIRPVNNPALPTGPSAPFVPIAAFNPAIPGEPSSGNVSSLVNLTPAQLADLFNQVGDAMYRPGFSYEAHIEGNTRNGVFTPPVYIPPNTDTLLTLPPVGSADYQRLLIETGGASANAGFNYAAHLAATVSQSRGDMSYDDVIRVILESGRTNFTDFDLAAYREATGSRVGSGSIFANTVVATVAINQLQDSVFLAMPAVGSAQYLALSQETGGASERPGFNYLAHVAAITSQNILTSLSYAEVITLIAETGRSDFRDFDLIAHRQEKLLASTLVERLIQNPGGTELTLPPVGSPEYQAILADTGLSDLTNFDYAAYLSVKHQTEIAVGTILGTSGDDLIAVTPGEEKFILIGGQGNDTIVSTANNSILIGGAGNDRVNGGTGLDRAVFTGTLSEYQISLAANEGLLVTDGTTNRDGLDTLSGVERLSFADTALALDTDGIAGQGYRLYRAAFDREPDTDGLGYWINALDEGADLVSNVAAGFINSQEFQELYGLNSTVDAFITRLYQNVLDRLPDAEGFAYWREVINSGTDRSQILVGFSDSDENIAQVADLVANGILYTEFTG